MCDVVFVCVFKALQHGFLNFETFDVTEYEHYEVSGKCNGVTVSGFHICILCFGPALT